MDQQWSVSKDNDNSSSLTLRDTGDLAGKDRERKRLDRTPVLHANRTKKSDQAQELLNSSLDNSNKKKTSGSRNPSPIKFVRSAAESTRSKATQQQRTGSRRNSRDNSRTTSSSPHKFVTSICERTRSRSLTPGSDSGIQSSFLRLQCDSRSSTPFLDTNTCLTSPQVTRRPDSDPDSLPQITNPLKNQHKIKSKVSVPQKDLKINKDKDAISPLKSEDDILGKKVTVFKSVRDALNALSEYKDTRVPVVCLRDVYDKPSHGNYTPSLGTVNSPSHWNQAILDRIRKVGRLLKSKENIDQSPLSESLVNKTDLNTMNIEAVLEEVARGYDQNGRMTVPTRNGIESTKSPKKSARRKKTENVPDSLLCVPQENSPKKATRKSPKKAKSGSTGGVVTQKTSEVDSSCDEAQPASLTIAVPDNTQVSEYANSLSPTKDADHLRQGRRIRSPSIRYADDMILFPLKSPRRSRSPKGDSTSPDDKVDDGDSRSSMSTEKTMTTASAQTSQLYSLLTSYSKETKTAEVQSETENTTQQHEQRTASPRGRKKTSPKSDSDKQSSRKKRGVGKSPKKDEDIAEKSRAVRELSFTSVEDGQVAENVNKQSDGKKEGVGEQVSEVTGGSTANKNPSQECTATGDTTPKEKDKKCPGRGSKKTKTIEMVSVKEEVLDDKYKSVAQKSQGLFDLISKVKNNMDYEKIFPGVVAELPFYALEDQGPDEENVEGTKMDSNSETKTDLKSDDSLGAESTHVKSEQIHNGLEGETDEKSGEKTTENDTGQEEIVDDFFSEDFLQTKKSPRKKSEVISEVKIDTSANTDNASDMKTTNSQTSQKDSSTDPPLIDSATKKTFDTDPSLFDTATKKTFESTSAKSLTPQEESRIPISPADVILVDKATSSTTNGKTLFEKFKEKEVREEETSNVDSTCGKIDGKDDKMTLLTIDIQERRNIFDAIMSDYSPREKTTNEETNSTPTKKNIQNVESLIKHSPVAKLISPVKHTDARATEIKPESSTATPSPKKSIVEKIQEKLGITVEESPRKTETERADVESVKNKKEETKEDVTPDNKDMEDDGYLMHSLNLSKDSSDFEICMGTVDEQQNFSESDDKSEPFSPRAMETEPSSVSSPSANTDTVPQYPTKHVPKTSFGKIIKEPTPLSVLLTVEQKAVENPSVFESDKLNDYLSDRSNLCLQLGKNKTESPVKKKVNAESNQEAETMETQAADDIEDMDQEEEEGELHSGIDRVEGIRGFSSIVEECDPEFDEVDGVLFISFPNEEALSAHIKVEQKSKIGKSEKILLGMARMKNIRQRQKQIRQTVHKKSWAKMKSLKAQFKIEGSLQGMHLVLAKYQRIYKRELVLNLLAKEEGQSQNTTSKLLQKTSDVTKIKGWKNKYGDLDNEGTLSLNPKGKLHWKTKESLLKSLHPDELREYGFDLKKKRRKNLIFTIRKGMSKGDGPGSKTEKVAESLDGATGVQDKDVLIQDGLEQDGGHVYGEEGETDIDDEEQRRLMEKKIKDSKKKYKTYFMQKLKMDETDIDVLRKLGGQRLGRALKLSQTAQDPQTEPQAHQDNQAVQEPGKEPGEEHDISKEPEIEIKQEIDDEASCAKTETESVPATPCKKKRKRRRNTFMIITLNSSMANFAVTALDKQFCPNSQTLKKQSVDGAVMLSESAEGGNMDVDESSREYKGEECNSRPSSRQSSCDMSNLSTPVKSRRNSHSDGSHSDSYAKDSKMCDKPGCRYGCICHLCQSWDTPSPPDDAPPTNSVTSCTKEYCRLGCICDSNEVTTKEHCGKPECMFECQCLPKRRAALQSQLSTTSLALMERNSNPSGRGGRGKGRGRRKSRETVMVEAEGVVQGEDPEYYPGGSKTNVRKYAGNQGMRRRGAGNSQRFSTLPKRESTYRLAKNLDAVSRKAMLVYETSEMYADLKSKTKKRQDSVDGQPPHTKTPPPTPTEGLMQPAAALPFTLKSVTPPGSTGTTAAKSTSSAKSKNLSQIDADLALFESDSEGDEGEEVSTCARMMPYNSARRRVTKCTCGFDHHTICSKTTVQSSVQSGKSSASLPSASDALTALTKSSTEKRDHIPLPGWHTQWVCLKNNKKPQYRESDGIKLLEIMSNCNWEPHKQKLLSKISVMLQEEGYPAPKKKPMGDYWVEFLPKSDKPAVIPYEVRKNIPDSIYAVRIKIFKKLDTQYVNQLIKEQEKILESRIPVNIDTNKTGRPPLKITSEAERRESEATNTCTSITGKPFSEQNTTLPKVSVVGSGISGLSKLQVKHQGLLEGSYPSTSLSDVSQGPCLSTSQCASQYTVTTNQGVSASSGVNMTAPSSVGFLDISSVVRSNTCTSVASKSFKSTVHSAVTSVTLTVPSTTITSLSHLKTAIPKPISHPVIAVKPGQSVAMSETQKSADAALELRGLLTKSSVINSPEMGALPGVSVSSKLITDSTKSMAQGKVTPSTNTIQAVVTSGAGVLTPSRLVPCVPVHCASGPFSPSISTLRPAADLKSSHIKGTGKLDHVGTGNLKMTVGMAVAQLVTPVTATGIDVTSTTLTSTVTTSALSAKPTTNATRTSSEKVKATMPCILDATKYSPLKGSAAKGVIRPPENVCRLVGTKTSPVTLLGPFDSPSKIPKVLPQMKVLQAKSVSKDGKPVIHLIPYTTPTSSASLPTNIMSVPITLTSVAMSNSVPDSTKIPPAHDVKPDSVLSKPKSVQPDLTTGCMFTVSNPMATTTSSSTSVPMETNVGSSITSPALSIVGDGSKILPRHGDQIILLSRGEANERVMEKLQSAPVVETAAFVTEGEDRQTVGTTSDSSRKEDADHVKMETKAGDGKDIAVDEKLGQKRKTSKQEDKEDSVEAKKRKVSGDTEQDSVLAKILASKDAEQAYVQYREVDVAVSADIKEVTRSGQGQTEMEVKSSSDDVERLLVKVEESIQQVKNVIDSIKPAGSNGGDTASKKSGKEMSDSDNDSEEEVHLQLDSSGDNKSDDTDVTIAGGLMESDIDLSNQSIEEKNSKDKQGTSTRIGENTDNPQDKQGEQVKPGPVSQTPNSEDQSMSENKEDGAETTTLGKDSESVKNVEKSKSVEECSHGVVAGSLLALELTKGQNGLVSETVDPDGQSSSGQFHKDKASSQESSKKRKPVDLFPGPNSIQEPQTKKARSDTQTSGQVDTGNSLQTDSNHGNSGSVLDGDEDWENQQMCMIEDTDNLTVVIPSDDEASDEVKITGEVKASKKVNMEEKKTDTTIDCVILESSDEEEVDVEGDSGIDTAQLLKKQAEFQRTTFKSTCSVHNMGKTKRKSSHNALSTDHVDDSLEFREQPNSSQDQFLVSPPEGLVVTPVTTQSTSSKRNKEIDRQRVQKRREELTQAFLKLAESLYGFTEGSKEYYSKFLSSTNEKCNLIKKGTLAARNLGELEKKSMFFQQSLVARNLQLKKKLNELKEYMTKERGMPWMVLQAHLDKIAKVCHKIFQNMPAILQRRGQNRPPSTADKALYPGITGLYRGKSPQGVIPLRPVTPRLLTPSIRMTNGNQNVNLTQSQGVVRMGKPSSSVSTAEQSQTKSKTKTDNQKKQTPAPKVGSAKRKPSVTTPAVYIDYAEDENEIEEDLLLDKADDDSHFGDHVTSYSLMDSISAVEAVKQTGIKVEPDNDDVSQVVVSELPQQDSKFQSRTLSDKSCVDTYRIESSSFNIGSALMNSPSTLSSSISTSSTVVQISMSDTGKMAAMGREQSLCDSQPQISDKSDNEQSLVIPKAKLTQLETNTAL